MNETNNQKPPWADEPTPLCEKAAMDGYYWTDQGSRVELLPCDYKRASNGEVVFIDFAQDLERRIRRAMKLVNSLRIDAECGDFDETDLERRLGELEETLQ